MHNRFDQPKENTYERPNYMTDREFLNILEKMYCPEGQTEIWSKSLDRTLKEIHAEINSEHKAEFKNRNGKKKKSGAMKIVEEDCTVRMNAFQIGEGGPFNKGEIKKDKAEIDRLKELWSDGKGLEIFDKERSKTHGELWEKALTIMLYKILPEFLVVRASEHDDIKNGIDNYLLDENGNAICGLDEVSTDDESELHQIKSDKVENKNIEGGATIKYGLAFNKENNIVKDTIKNIPVFYIRISGEKLVTLLKAIYTNPSLDKISDVEFEIFDELTASLKRQIERERNNEKIPEIVQEKICNFSDSLARMQEIKDEKYQQKHKE